MATTDWFQAAAADSSRAAGGIAFSLAFLASVLGLVSIAASHTLLGLALPVLLWARLPARLPRAALPLGGFLLWTLLSLAASPYPAAGLPQAKKFYVFLFFPVIFWAVRRLSEARRLLEAWFIVGSVAAVVGAVQFGGKWLAAREAGRDFLAAYQGDRITGFFSHWMTFSQAGLIVLLALIAYLMFSEYPRRPGRWIWAVCAAMLALSVEALSYTRSVWVATAVAGGYLVWRWRPRWLLAAPLLVAVALLLAPSSLARRAASITDFEANSARLIMWRTGARMVAAHPVLGVGPEQVGPRFAEFLPADVSQLPAAYYGHLHNMYVHYAAERGLPAVAFLVWFLLQILADHLRALRRLPAGRSDARFVLHAVVAATLAVMTAGCFDVTLGDSEVLAIYLALAALGYRALAALPQPGQAAEPA